MATEKRSSLWSTYVNIVGVVDKSVNYALGEWGAIVAHRPVITMVASLIVSLGLMAGLVLIVDNVESESDKLWVPQDSIWLSHEKYLTPRLGRTDRAIQVVFEAKEDGGNVLTSAAIREMFKVYDAMAAVTVDAKAGGDAVISWADGICDTTALGTCRSQGILRFFNDSSTDFESVATDGEQAVLNALSSDTYPDGGSANPDDIFYGATRSADGTLQSASMVQWIGVMAPEVSKQENIDWGLALEERLVDEEAGPITSNLQSSNFYFSHPTSVDNAIGASVAGDIPLIAVAFTVIMIFATLVLFVKDRVYSKVSLALVGITTVALSIGAAFGLSLYFTIPFTSLSQLMPFIILGIGVDDIFVMVRSMEEVSETHRGAPIPEKFRKALRLGGMSITVTSLTNFAAFMFGSLTKIPAIKWFCWTAAIAVALVWALQLTLFLAYFVLNERRIAGSRYDCACCWKRPEPSITDPSAVQSVPVGILSSNKDSYLQLVLNKYMLPAILSPIGKLVIVGLVIATSVLGGIGVSRLDEGLPLGDLAPDDHYFKLFYDRQVLFQSQSGQVANVYFRYVDHAEPAIQAKLLQAKDLVYAADYVDAELSPATNWLKEFQAFVARNQPGNVTADGSVRKAAFNDQLGLFLTQQPIWKDSVYFEGGADSGKIEVSSMQYVNVADVEDSGDYIRRLLDNMLDVQEAVNKDVFAAENDASGAEGDVLMVNGGIYKYGETDRIIFRELLTNLGFALLGIAVISLVTLIHPAAVVLIVLCILLVDLGLFAEMWLFGIRLNTISVVSLVMAVGLAVDYSLHIMHTFLHKTGDKTERVKKTMLDIGAAVVLGLISTLLGVIVLAFSSSTIIRTFFQLLVATVLFAGLMGILFLSVVLTFVGPKPLLMKEGEEDGVIDGKMVDEPMQVTRST